jgi:hypothetical protein
MALRRGAWRPRARSRLSLSKPNPRRLQPRLRPPPRLSRPSLTATSMARNCKFCLVPGSSRYIANQGPDFAWLALPSTRFITRSRQHRMCLLPSRGVMLMTRRCRFAQIPEHRALLLTAVGSALLPMAKTWQFMWRVLKGRRTVIILPHRD